MSFWQTKKSEDLQPAPKKSGSNHQNNAQRYMSLLKVQLKGTSIPLPVMEYKFHPLRRYRIDFCWPDPSLMIALEVEGGTFTSTGGHRSIQNYHGDVDKYNEIALAGFLLIRVLPEWLELEDGRAFFLIERAHQARKAETDD